MDCDEENLEGVPDSSKTALAEQNYCGLVQEGRCSWNFVDCRRNLEVGFLVTFLVAIRLAFGANRAFGAG